MANRTNRAACLARASALSVAATLLTPIIALAEEERSGIDLLIPAAAELIPACIAFLIIFIVMAKLVWPPIVKMMDERENKINEDINAAEKARVDAETDAKAYEERLADADQEVNEIIANARRRAEEERNEILAAAQREAAETIARGKDVVETERKKAMEELSKSVVDLSVEIAGKIIGNDLSDDEHRKLAEKYLQEVGGTNAD